MSPLWGIFNYGRGKYSQGVEKVKHSQYNNPSQPQGSEFKRGRDYDARRGRPVVCFKFGE